MERFQLKGLKESCIRYSNQCFYLSPSELRISLIKWGFSLFFPSSSIHYNAPQIIFNSNDFHSTRVCESESVIVYVCLPVSTEPNNLYYVGNDKNSLWVSSIPDGDVKREKQNGILLGILEYGMELRKRERERKRDRENEIDAIVMTLRILRFIDIFVETSIYKLKLIDILFSAMLTLLVTL